eukprot:1689211-Rhodomonas_salina.1
MHRLGMHRLGMRLFASDLVERRLAGAASGVVVGIAEGCCFETRQHCCPERRASSADLSRQRMCQQCADNAPKVSVVRGFVRMTD